jgi:hypothetical protein
MKELSGKELSKASTTVALEPITLVSAFQKEVLHFMTRRAQACTSWQSEIAQCRSPQDVLHQQAKFMRELLSDCEASSSRLMVLFTGQQLALSCVRNRTNLRLAKPVPPHPCNAAWKMWRRCRQRRLAPARL